MGHLVISTIVSSVTATGVFLTSGSFMLAFLAYLAAGMLVLLFVLVANGLTKKQH